MKTFVFTPPDDIHSARASTCCIKRSRGTSARGHFIFRALTPDRKNKRPFHPCPPAARRRRQRLLARGAGGGLSARSGARSSGAQQGVAWLCGRLDLRRRSAEGCVSGVSRCESLGTTGWGTGALKRWQPRTPAMAAGLTERVWSLREVLMYRVPPWPQLQGG
jgi:hypothetical protein